MKNNLLFVIIDNIFIFILLFTLNLIWCLYFFAEPLWGVIVAVAISVIEIVVYKLISRKKRAKNNIKLQELKRIQQIRDTFIYMPKEIIVNFFFKLASTKHTAIAKTSYVVVGQEQKVIVYPMFKIANLSADELIDIYNSVKEQSVKKIIVLCNTFEQDVLNVIKNFSIKTLVLDYMQTYNDLLKEYSFYPEITQTQTGTAKYGFKQLLLLAFDKKKTRGYVVSALFIAFASVFVRYKIYYLIVASLLILMAIACQFSLKFNKSPQKDSLLG